MLIRARVTDQRILRIKYYIAISRADNTMIAFGLSLSCLTLTSIVMYAVIKKRDNV